MDENKGMVRIKEWMRIMDSFSKFVLVTMIFIIRKTKSRGGFTNNTREAKVVIYSSKYDVGKF